MRTWDDTSLKDLLEEVDTRRNCFKLGLNFGALRVNQLNRVLDWRQDDLGGKVRKLRRVPVCLTNRNCMAKHVCVLMTEAQVRPN